MHIGGLGGIGLGRFSLGGVSGINANMTAGGCASAIDQAGMTSGLSPQMNQLIELMQGMNTAQILMALMLASAGKKDDEEGNSDAAIGFLAGLALASQMNQMPMPMQLACDFPASGIQESTGGNLNLLA